MSRLVDNDGSYGPYEVGDREIVRKWRLRVVPVNLSFGLVDVPLPNMNHQSLVTCVFTRAELRCAKSQEESQAVQELNTDSVTQQTKGHTVCEELPRFSGEALARKVEPGMRNCWDMAEVKCAEQGLSTYTGEVYRWFVGRK